MGLFGKFRGPGVGDPDLEGTQYLITQGADVITTDLDPLNRAVAALLNGVNR